MGSVWDQPGISGTSQVSKGELLLIPQHFTFSLAVGPGGSNPTPAKKGQPVEAALFHHHSIATGTGVRAQPSRWNHTLCSHYATTVF